MLDGNPIPAPKPGASHKLLVIDTNYTLEGLRERQIEESITCRDLDGFFEHVWSVHPFATLVTSKRWGPRNGRPDSYALAPRHTIIEGRVGRFNWPRWAFPFNFLASQAALFRRLRRLILEQRIEVIRVASPLYTGLFGWLLARTTGAKLVVRVGANHDKFFETTGRPVEPRLMRSRAVEKKVEHFIFSRADLVAGANQDNLDFALANGARLERSTLFRYGNLIDRRHFSDPGERTHDAGVFDALDVCPEAYLLYVGRLEPIKQVDSVVRVLDHVRRAGFLVTAIIVGEGTLRDELKRLTAQLGVSDHVRFPGNFDQGRLASLYAAAGVFVSPHTGRALNEAALGAAPVVAFDIDWQAELIENGKTGILVPAGNIEAMATGVATLLRDRKRARQLGQRLRQRALSTLDPEALNAHERKAYRRLLTQGRTK